MCQKYISLTNHCCQQLIYTPMTVINRSIPWILAVSFAIGIWSMYKLHGAHNPLLNDRTQASRPNELITLWINHKIWALFPGRNLPTERRSDYAQSSGWKNRKRLKQPERMNTKPKQRQRWREGEERAQWRGRKWRCRWIVKGDPWRYFDYIIQLN